MSQVMQVMLVGAFADEIQEKLQDVSEIKLTVQSEFTLPLSSLPDLLILEFSDDYQSALKTLSSIPVETRPVLLAVIPSEDSQILRTAMNAGARDYVLQPVDSNNLLSIVHGFLSESKDSKKKANGKVTAIISANSNAEAAFISGNLAQITTVQGTSNTAIIDLDLQFSGLPLMLDIVLEHSLLQALEVSEALDEIAIDAYLAKHHSGLKVMGSLTDEIALPGEVSVDKIRHIIGITAGASENVFINLPKIIDPLSSQVMEDADNIVVCVDQSFSCLNYSKGLLNILLNELDIPRSKITVLINHYQKKNKIKQKDIEQALGVKSTVVLPFDLEHVHAAERYSLLLQEAASQSQAMRHLKQLAEDLSGQHFTSSKSIVSRIREKFGVRSE